MRYLAVFATVVVAAAHAAAAPPEQEKNTKQDENTARVRYGDEGPPNSRNAIGGKAKSDAPGHEAGAWLQLATPTPAKHGTEFVFVGKEQGAFDKLRIDAEKGTVIVRRVRIYFDDGKQQVYDVDRALNARHKSAFVELKSAQPIDRIVVTTEQQTNGTYALYGSSVEGVATR